MVGDALVSAEDGSPTPARNCSGSAVLVLICKDLEAVAPGLNLGEVGEWLLSRLKGLTVRLEEGLCHRPSKLKNVLELERPHRIVIGLCSREYPRAELQAHVRSAGLDPLGVQVVVLGHVAGAKAVASIGVLLGAAVARARAFPGSEPENLKAEFLSTEQRVSRRGLFTLPPVSYVSVPTVGRTRCAASEGCDLCVRACPRAALDRDGDTVSVDRSRCQSCGICVEACPHRAVDFPGWSPQELEAELSWLLATDLDPRAVLFRCESNAVPAGNGWLPVRVPCTAAVPVAAILQALAQGATIVGLYPCVHECCAGQGGVLRRRVDYCRELLELLGDSPDRIVLLRADGGCAESPPLRTPVPGEAPTRAVGLFGRGAAAQAVGDLAARYGASGRVLEHAGSPLGVVSIDAESCTGCGTCAAACPTDALVAYTRADRSFVLGFDHCLCTGCGGCVAACPERAARAINVKTATDLRRLSAGTEVAFQDQELVCQGCGDRIAARRMLQRIAALLGDEHNPRLVERLCAKCRGMLSASA